jgi:protein phosphatase
MRAAALSDIGLVRTKNEDAHWSDPRRGIFIIADGLGAHKAGEVASGMAVEITSAELTIAVDRGLKDVELIEAMDEAFRTASAEIYDRAQSLNELSGMACSLLAAVLQEESCLVAHVGDSRAYLLLPDSFSQVTVDDTPVAAMVKRGYLLPDKARFHSMKNVLVKSVGNKREVEANVIKFPVKSKERLLLCSDGLWSMVEEETMNRILRKNKNLQKACQELVKAARESGGKDNITVIIVEAGTQTDSTSELDETAEMPNKKP